MKLRTKKAWSLGIAAMLMASFVFAGCGKSADNPSENATPTEAASEAASEDDAATTGATAEATAEATATDEATSTPEADSSDRDSSELSLKDAYADRFQIGVAANSWQLEDPETMGIISKDFSSITCENEMKPDYILDYDATVASKDGMPQINMENVDRIMTMAEKAGLKMRGHTLVWHSQTPDWLFYKDYDTSKEYVNKKTMLKRMESYIKKVMTFCKEKHPGLVYAWDVVNEAFSDDPEGGYRTDSPWYEIIGEEYIEKAFEYARKYAEEGTKLFLNDYNTTSESKRASIYAAAYPIAEKGLLDGIGMQSHHDMEYVSVNTIKGTIFKFAQIPNIEIQLTELDLHNTDNSDEGYKAQAEVYGELFKMLADMKDAGNANITSVTFWGLSDATTWLTANKNETSYPLLYDVNMKAKPAYFAVYDAAAKE